MLTRLLIVQWAMLLLLLAGAIFVIWLASVIPETGVPNLSPIVALLPIALTVLTFGIPLCIATVYWRSPKVKSFACAAES
jgi:preprotein translocase subunit SecY